MKRLIIISLIFLIVTGNIISQPPEPTPPVSWGEVWLVHPDTVELYSDFTCEIHLNSGSQKLAAYEIDLNFDDRIIEVVPYTGSSGVEAGPDGFLAASLINPGYIKISGYDVYGTGPGTDMHILTVHFTALSEGTTTLTPDVTTLVAPDSATIGNPFGIESLLMVIDSTHYEPPVTISPSVLSIEYPELSAQAQVVEAYYYGWSILAKSDWVTITPPNGTAGTTITVTIDFSQFVPYETKEGSVVFLNNATTGIGSLQVLTVYIPLIGDVNSDSAVDIIDALLIAQYYVSLNPAGFNPDAADTNCSGTIDIIDALLTAQFYVGLLTELCDGTTR